MTWKERLAEPTPDWDMMLRDAMEWPSCYIGERVEEFFTGAASRPNAETYVPPEGDMRYWGCEFAKAIQHRDRVDALTVIKGIDNTIERVGLISAMGWEENER